MEIRKKTALLTLGAWMIAGFLGTAMAAEPIVVGLFGPMSGERAALGTRFKEGVAMYVDAINAAGGIGGRQIEIRPEDSRGNPREAANIAQKFAQDSSMLAVVGGWSSTESMAAAPILAEAGMPQVSPTASHPDYSKISKYQFRITNTQKLLAPVHADMLAKRLSMKKIAILYFQDDWGIYVNNSTAEKLKQTGAQVVLQEAMIPEARDFRALVTKVKAAEPDGIFLASHYVESGIFMRQLRQAGIKLTVAATDTLNNPKFIELAGDAANGVVMPTPFLPNAPAAKDFTKAYNARWNRMPDYYSAFSHDAILVIGAAIKKLTASGKPLTRETLRDTLANLEPQQGVSGKIKFDAQGDPLDRKMEMLIVKDGAYHPFK